MPILSRRFPVEGAVEYLYIPLNKQMLLLQLFYLQAVKPNGTFLYRGRPRGGEDLYMDYYCKKYKQLENMQSYHAVFAPLLKQKTSQKRFLLSVKSYHLTGGIYFLKLNNVLRVCYGEKSLR